MKESKNYSKYILIIVVLAITAGNAYSQKKSVLFLGNSYTSANNLPATFYELALSMGDTVVYDSYTPGGARLLTHSANSTSLDKISSAAWDYVILQAQSQEPSWPESQLESEVYPHAVILNDSIKSNNPCTETVFYMTWGRKYGDDYNCAGWPPVCTYLGMQERLMAGYMTMAAMTQATVAPVGLAWKNSMDIDTDSLINLYSADNSHPSVSGTYLTACVLYATIFQKSPVGATYVGSLNPLAADHLQAIAENTVLSADYSFQFNDTFTGKYYDLTWQSWFEKGNIPFADYSYTQIDNYNVEFADSSLNAVTYKWYVDGVYFSSDPSPIYDFGSIGEYQVTLDIQGKCISGTMKDTVIIENISSIEYADYKDINIFPNPASDLIKIKSVYSSNQRIVLYNILGEPLCRKITKDYESEIDISELSSGVYFIKVYSDERLIHTARIIKK